MAVIQGDGFHSNGGFAKVIINGVAYPAQDIANALQVVAEVAVLGAGRCTISPKLAQLARSIISGGKTA